MSKFAFLLIFLAGCSTGTKLNSFNDVAKINLHQSKTPLGRMEIEDETKLDEGGTNAPVLILSENISLCIPEFLAITGGKIKFAQISSIYLIKYFKEDNSEWNRFRLIDDGKRLEHSGTKSSQLDKSLIEKYFIKLPTKKDFLTKREKALRIVNETPIKASVVETYKKEKNLVFSDLDLSPFFKDFVKLRTVEKSSSFRRIKKQCKSISEELYENLNKAL